MRVYKIIPGIGCNPCIESNPNMLVDWFTESQVDEIITVEILEMSEEEYKALPEYQGP